MKVPYVLFCEEVVGTPDICYLRLVDLQSDTITITQRGRHTWFSLLKSARFDLLTDNFRRALQCAHVWEPLEKENDKDKKAIREMDIKLITSLVDRRIIQYCEKCDRYFDVRSGCPADIKSEECAVDAHH